jgi:hypothetical protein
MAELNNDPRTQGVSGIKGLKGLTRDEIREELFKSVPTLKDEWGDSSKRFGKTSFENIIENYGYRGILEYNRAAQDNSSDSEYIAPEDFGHSTYDKEASTLADVEDLEDLRGRNQSGLLQLTNGAIKFGGTAASSFVDGTVGVLWGLGAAVAEGDLSAFYNNAYAEASKDFRDGMEKWFPNYRETEERENYEKGEWYKNILTANFFGDHVMKTAGYTVGAVAAGSAAVKALSLAGRFVNPTVARVTATSLSSSSEAALMANEAFNDNLKEGSKLLNTAASQELNTLTEDYLSIRSSLETELKGLDDMDKADELAAALGEDKDAGAFKKVRDERRGEILKALKELEKDYTERANNLKEQQAITEAEVYSRAKDAGDKVFLANMALLGVSEYFSVGRLYERLAKGKISSDAKSLIDIVQHRAKVDKEITKRAIKQAAYEPIQEGLIEEGGQSMIDETVKAAYLTDDVEAYRDALRNKESLKKGLDVIDAFGKGFAESYGNPAVWEEIAIGGLMGMTGTVSVGKSNNSTNDTWLGKGKFLGMKGGAIGEIMAARRGLKEAEAIAADVNKQLQNYVDPDGTIKRDIGVQAHFRDATEGWDRDTHKFGTLNKQANADFALVQTLYDIGQAKYLETLIDGVDIDQMTDKQLEETAKLLKITDSTGNNLKSDTKEGREEIKELLKRDRDDVKQAIKNFNTAYNVTEHLTRGISIDDDTKRELAYLNFKVLNFQDRSEAIREKYSKELLDLNSKLRDKYSNSVEESLKEAKETKELENKKRNNELALNSIISNMKNVQGNIRRLLQQQSKGTKKRQRIKNAKKNAAELEAYEKAESILLEREKEIKSTIEEIEAKGIKDLKALEDTLSKLISLYNEVTRNYNYIYNLEGADSKKPKVLTPEAVSKVIDKFEDYIESIYTEGGLYEEGNKKSAKEFTKAVIDLSALSVAGEQFKERVQDFLEEDKRTKIEEKRREKEEKQRVKDFLKEMDKKDVSEITEDEIKELEKINNRKSKSILKKIERYNKKKAKQQAVQNKIDGDIKNNARQEEDITENTEEEEVEDAAKADMIKYIEEFLKKDFTGVVVGDVLLEASLASMFATHLGDSRVKRIADKLKSLTPYLYDRVKKVIGESADVIEVLNAQSSHIEEEAVEQLQKYASTLSREDYQNAKEGVITQLVSYFKDYIEDLNKVGEEVEEEIENIPDSSELEENEDNDDDTPPVEPNEEPDDDQKDNDSSEDSLSTDENTEGEGTNDNTDTNTSPSNEDSESENTPSVNVNHVGPNQFPGWKPDVTEFWTHANENGGYLPSNEAIEGKVKRTNREGKEYNLDYTSRQKIIFKVIYEFLKKKGAFEVVDRSIDSGEKLRFTVHYELVKDINEELKNNNEKELETYPIVIENGNGMVLNVCGLDYTINNEGGINVTQTDIDAIKKEITEKAKKYKEENPEAEYYVSDFESEIKSMMYGVNVPVNPKLNSLSKEQIKDLKVGVLQKINEDGSYTLLVGDNSITVTPSSNYVNTLGTPFVVKEIEPGKYKAVQLFLNDDTKTKIEEVANEMFKNGADLEAIKTFLGDIFNQVVYEISTSSKSITIKNATFSLKAQSLNAIIPKELLVTPSLEELKGRNIGNILASFGEVNDINFSSKNTWFTFDVPSKKQNSKASTPTPEKVAGVNNTVASLFAEAKDASTSSEIVKSEFINVENAEEEEKNNPVLDTDSTEANSNSNDVDAFINKYNLGWLKEKNPDLFKDVDFETVEEVVGMFSLEDMSEEDWIGLINHHRTNPEKYRTKEKEGYEKINMEKEKAWFRKKFPNLSEDRIIKHVDNLIKIKGNRVAYGMYKRGIITLSKLAATGTLYHESFHFVFDLFISNKEKEDIYNEAREKFNLKTQSDIEIEEQLAEAFRRYVQLEETPILGSLIHIFRELKHFIQNFIGNEPYINKLFYKINNAKIDTSKLQESSSQEMLSQYTQEMLDIKAKAIADGTFMKAPNGKPSNLNERQWLHVRTKAFKKWFGDWENDPENASKVVDENGEPLEVYHTSTVDFNAFDLNKRNSNDPGYYGKGFYFYPRASDLGLENPIIKSYFLNIKNPLLQQSLNFSNTGKELPSSSDGSIVRHWDSDSENIVDDIAEILVNNPNQIKSATDNIGTYDESNDDIRYREVEESENERDFWIGLVEKAGFNVTRLSNKEIQIESNKAINLFGTGNRGIGFYDEENNFTFPNKKEYEHVKSLIEDSKDSTIVSTESYTYLTVNNKPMVVLENGSIEESLFIPLIDKYYVKSLRELEVLKIHKKLATSTKYAKGKTARKDGLLPISEYEKNIRVTTLDGFFGNKSVDDILKEIDEDIKGITNINKDQTEEQYRHSYKSQITEVIEILSKYFSGDINNFLNGVYKEQAVMTNVLLGFNEYPDNIKEKIKNYLLKILKPLENPSADSFNDLYMFSAFGAIVGYDNFAGDSTHVYKMAGKNISLDALLNNYISDETSFREILKNPVFYITISDKISINEMRNRYTEHGISKGFLSESKLVTLSYPEIQVLSFEVLHKHLGLEAIQDIILNNTKAINITEASYLLNLKEVKNNKKLYLSLLLETPFIRDNSADYFLDRFANLYNIPTEQFSGDLLIDALYIMQEISTREDLKNAEGVEKYISIINKVIQQAVLQRTKVGKILNEDDLKKYWLDLNYDAAFDEPTTTKKISYTNPDEKFVDISNQELVKFIKGLNSYISNFDPLMFVKSQLWDTIREVAEELPRIYDIIVDHIDNPSISVNFINIEEEASYNGEYYSEIPSNEFVEKQINDFLNNIPERYRKSFDISLLLNKVQRKEVLQDLYKRGVFSEYIENKGIDMLAIRKIHPANLEWMMKYDDWDMVYPSIGLINPEGLYSFANSDITLLFSNNVLDHKDVAIYPGDAYTPSFYSNRKLEVQYINREITAEDTLNALKRFPDVSPDHHRLLQSKISKEDIKVLWNPKNKEFFRSIWKRQSFGELKIKNLLNVKDTVKAIVAPIQNKSKLENSDFFKNTGIKFYFYEGNQGSIEEKEAFRRAYEENKADIKFSKKDGVILGFTKDGNIFINTDLASPTTSVHEYTHTWVDALRMHNSELYKRGMEICKEFTDLWEELAEDSHYGKRWSDLTTADYEHEMMSEIVSRLTSEVADSIFKTIKKGTLLQRLKSWIEEFTSFIKETFTNWSTVEASKVTPEQFFKMPIVDLHKGINPNTIKGITETKEEQLFSDNTKKFIAQDSRYNEGEKNSDRNFGINKQTVTEEESIEEKIKIYEYRYSRLEYDNLSPTDIEYLKSIGMPKKVFNLLPVAVRENLLLCK